jgi:hypothetical protein
VRPNKLSVIGNGVVFDPRHFLDEVAKLKGQGVAVGPDNLRIADNATLILPLHRELDAFARSSNAITSIGTTRRGIGPAYEDKVGRRAIRLIDLADLDTDACRQDRPPAGAPQCAAPRPRPAGDRRQEHAGRAVGDRAEGAALCRHRVAAARR